jgi:hypothetical protein
MLVIELPVLDPPELSGSGKTLVVATSRGGRRTSLKVDKKSVVINVNAYIRQTSEQEKAWNLQIKTPQQTIKATQSRAQALGGSALMVSVMRNS